MLDRALRLTLRDLSTYVLIAAVVALPLHVIHGFVFQRVVAVSDLHGNIEDLPADQAVRTVGPTRLSAFRLSGLSVALLELVSIPLVVGATRRVLAVREDGELPSVKDAWRHASQGTRGSLRGLRHPRIWLPAALIAFAIGFLAERSGLLLIEPLGDGARWAGDAFVRATARSLGAPFLVTPLALMAGAKEPWSQMPNPLRGPSP